MANLNKVFLIGNLTRDPELRYTPSGTAVVEFGMAMNRRWGGGQGGEKREETCFVDVQAWARSAEVISEYCKKGQPLFVEGRLQLNTWEGKDGQKRSRMRVVVENFQFLGAPSGRGGGNAAGTKPAPKKSPTPPAEAQPDESSESDAPPPSDAPQEGEYQIDDDIPF